MNLTDAFPDRKMNTWGYRSIRWEWQRVVQRMARHAHGDVDEQN